MGMGMGMAAHRHGLSSAHQLRDRSRQSVRAKLDRLWPMDRWLRACAIGAADALCAGIGRDAHAPGGRTTADHVRPAGALAPLASVGVSFLVLLGRTAVARPISMPQR